MLVKELAIVEKRPPNEARALPPAVYVYHAKPITIEMDVIVKLADVVGLRVALEKSHATTKTNM